MSNQVIVSKDSWNYGDDPVYFDWSTGTVKIREGFDRKDRCFYLTWAESLSDSFDSVFSDLERGLANKRARVAQFRELYRHGICRTYMDLRNLFPHWFVDDQKWAWGLWIQATMEPSQSSK